MNEINMDKGYAQIKRLSDRLTALKIPHVNMGECILFKERMVDYIFNSKIIYNKAWMQADVICKPGSYGYDDGLFEIMGADLMTPEECAQDDVVGYLTMEDVIERIVKAYHKFYKRK